MTEETLGFKAVTVVLDMIGILEQHLFGDGCILMITEIGTEFKYVFLLNMDKAFNRQRYHSVLLS